MYLSFNFVKVTIIDSLFVFLLKGIGRFLAFIPECIPQLVSILLGDIIYYWPGSLRRGLLSNLHHAFPEKSLNWHKKIARESCRRTIEMGLFVLASPYISKKRLQTSFILDDFYQQAIESGESYVILVPHFSGMEAITLTSLLFNRPIPETGVIYRPFNNRALELYIKETRQRGGVSLLSRKEGFTNAMEILRRKGNVAILFDQNAGNQGSLTLFFDRLVSATELPGLLVQRFQAECGVLYTERTGFWRGKMRAENLNTQKSTHAITLASNDWLEKKLKENDNFCADWLWLHQRWKTQNEAAVALRLQSGRNLLNETLSYKNYAVLPKKTRIGIRMPNWLGDVVMAIPLIKSLQKGRPDAEIILFTQPQFVSLLQALNVGDRIQPLPKKGFRYFWKIRPFKYLFIDRLIIMTHSLRSDIEALLIQPKVSHGMLLPGRSRFKIDEVWTVPHNLNLADIHQTDLWSLWFKNLGLQIPLQNQPLSLPINHTIHLKLGIPNHPYIALIAGSENHPQKRWSVPSWRELIGHLICAYPDYTFIFLGTAKDNALIQKIVTGFKDKKIINLSGKTNLLEFAHLLSGASVVIGNDTGGLHLANILGKPIIGLYGPTNPKRTGPIYDAERILLQPPGTLPTGGGRMQDLSSHLVLKALEKILGKGLDSE